MEADQPDWSLLPDRPAEFFELEPDFDQTELKRAYTRLIRRFKPERHPAEFKRIRGAYEALEARLRYSGAEPAPPEIQFQAPRAAEQARVDAAELVRELGPSAARARLLEQTVRDPAAWCAIALIDDALTDDPLAGLRTLIGAAKSTGGHRSVLALLQGFLHLDIEPKAALEVLQEFARAAARVDRADGYPPPLFWYFTDRLWCELAAQLPFDTLRDVFERCSELVGDAGRSHEWILKLRLRRRVAFTASAEWLEAVDAELAEQLRNLPRWVADEFDRVLWFDRYREVREEFLAAHPFRAVLDTALVAIVSRDEVDADREVLGALVECVERRDELLEAFGPQDDSVDVALDLLTWYVEGWSERRSRDTAPPAQAAERCAEFVQRLDLRSGRSFFGQLWRISGWSLVAVVVLCSFLVAAAGEPYLGDLWWFGGVALLGSVAVALRRGWLTRPVHCFNTPFGAWLHPRVWRPECAQFLAESRVPFAVLVEAFASEDSPGHYLMHDRISADRSLHLHSLAVRTID
jgi:hypothetical protein